MYGLELGALTWKDSDSTDRQTDRAGDPEVTILFALQVTREAGEALSRGCAGEMPPLHECMGSSIGACIPPAPARSRGAWGCNGEIGTSCCPPPHHCTARCGEANTDGEQEGSAQTDLPEGVGAAISLPGTAVQQGATHLNCPQPLLYLQMCVMGGQEKLLPHPCTGHKNGVHWSHPRDYVGAPPQADSTGSAQLHGETWLEPAQRSRMLAPGLLLAGTGVLVGASTAGAHLCCSQTHSCGPRQGWRAAVRQPEGPCRARPCWGWR